MKNIREESENLLAPFQLFSAGEITGARVAELKEKYALLHKTVISLQESEIQLLQEARCLSAELEQQQHELEKAEQFPEESSSEVSQIRQQLLSCQNEYSAITEREYEVQFKLECLQEEKRLLENEYERIPPKQETDQKIKQLRNNCDDLCKEVIQRKAEINAIREDISSKQKLTLTDKKEMERLLEKQADLKHEVVKIHGVPAQLGKETEKMNRKKINAEKEKEALSEQIEELNDTLKAIEKRTEEILQEREDVVKELDEKQVLLESKGQEHINLMKLLELCREKESAALSDRDALDGKLNKCGWEKKKQHDVLVHNQTRKEKELRHFKKLEVQLDAIYYSLEQDKPQHNRLKLEAEAVSKSNGALLERRRGLQKEVELIKRRLAEQEMMSETDAHMLEECIAEERCLFKEQEKCRAELTKLAHQTSIKAEEREQQSRLVQKTQIQLQSLIKEIKRKDLEIRECEKRKRKVEKQLQGFAKIHEVINNEKKKSMNLVQAAQQKASELKKQIKLLENEIANLRNTLITNERKLQKQRVKNTNNLAIAASLKSDYRKAAQILHEEDKKKEQQCLDLEELTNTVIRAEEELVQLHKNYERAIQQHNESGLLLRGREEELCILYEKINTQEMLCRNGDIEVQVMDEEIRFLKLKVAEKKRQNQLSFKGLTVKNALDAQLVVLQIQYCQCKDRIKQMEAILVHPTNESRKQDLGGKDPSPPELLRKIEQLQVQLVQKEDKLLETDVLYKHVCCLTDRLRAAAEKGRQDTLLLAKRTSELQKKIRDRNRKLMALVAELCMKRALATKLQQEMRDKEQFLVAVSSKLDQGLPPPKEAENEWLKVLRNEKMQKEAAEARAKHAAEEEQAAAPNCVHTTAEQRPTAYVPDDEHSLPVPRPYGALTPFKPSEPGSNMRHFRKPAVKPIEF